MNLIYLMPFKRFLQQNRIRKKLYKWCNICFSSWLLLMTLVYQKSSPLPLWPSPSHVTSTPQSSQPIATKRRSTTTLDWEATFYKLPPQTVMWPVPRILWSMIFRITLDSSQFIHSMEWSQSIEGWLRIPQGELSTWYVDFELWYLKHSLHGMIKKSDTFEDNKKLEFLANTCTSPGQMIFCSTPLLQQDKF